ncbi:MAG: GFA family protein [Paracoccaceae bacterium]
MRGSCLCGAVKYSASGTARSIVACHCNQCRKTSGHYVAATQVKRANLEVQGADMISWYLSSKTAKRAFCGICGSQLFWIEIGSDDISIMAGSVDGKTELEMDRQICTDTKGDYYALPNIEKVDQTTL